MRCVNLYFLVAWSNEQSIITRLPHYTTVLHLDGPLGAMATGCSIDNVYDASVHTEVMCYDEGPETM